MTEQELIQAMQAGKTVVLNRKKNGAHHQATQFAQSSGIEVYIGRQNGWIGLSKSIWHNPYKVGKDGDRAQVIAKFEQYLLTRPDLMEQIHTLKGKALTCWCKPESCHGDVLKKYADKVSE